MTRFTSSTSTILGAFRAGYGARSSSRPPRRRSGTARQPLLGDSESWERPLHDESAAANVRANTSAETPPDSSTTVAPSAEPTTPCSTSRVRTRSIRGRSARLAFPAPSSLRPRPTLRRKAVLSGTRGSDGRYPTSLSTHPRGSAGNRLQPCRELSLLMPLPIVRTGTSIEFVSSACGKSAATPRARSAVG